MTTREGQMPAEVGVIVPGTEVSEEVRQAAEKAARRARSKHTRGVELVWCRKENEDEATGRCWYERMHREALAELAEELELPVPVVALLQLQRVPESPLGRVGLDAPVQYAAPDKVTVRADVEASPSEVAFMVFWVFRAAVWDLAGKHYLLKRHKLFSTDQEEDCQMYARNCLQAGAPWE